VLCLYIRLRLKCDGTRAEARLRLSAKRTSPFKSAGASVQSITDSRVVRISGSNAAYTIFRGSVKSTGYPLHSPVSPFTPVRHRVPSHFNWTLPNLSNSMLPYLLKISIQIKCAAKSKRISRPHSISGFLSERYVGLFLFLHKY
jgi:hypothetical protein